MTRIAFQHALIKLVQATPYSGITVTDIARQAGFARHTFYNHYETKEDLLSSLIDIVFEQFFSRLEQWNFNLNGPEDERTLITSFFKVWEENTEIVQILKNLDIDDLLIKHLKAHSIRFYYDQVVPEIPGTEFALARYISNFNAYTLLGILKPWLQDDMKYPPEVMAEFLIQLTGTAQRRKAIERFKNIIR